MSRLKNAWRCVGLVLGLVAISIAGFLFPLGDWLRGFSDWIRQFGIFGAVIFVAVYAIAAVLFLPGSVFTIAAGLIYGVVAGTAVALTGATLGASLAFLAGRHLFRFRIEKYASGNERFAAIDQAIGQQGWKIVGLLRLSPLIPYNASNYFYGITSIGFWPYLLASLFGMLPGAFLYAYLGAIGRVGLSGGGPEGVLQWVFLGVGLLVTIAATILVSHVAKKALKKRAAAK
jgi:uncharacterized membrane protein YdjX (TVP38/TMEM64 family)